MKPNYKMLYGAAVGFVVVVSSLTLAAFVFHIRSGPSGDWAGHVFAGRVTTMATSTVTVTDARGKIKEFTITKTTVFLKGREHIDSEMLTPGTFVMVEGAPLGQGMDEAKEIRVVTTKMKNDNKHNPQ